MISTADTRTPLISVIVLNYNGARWIERCLESLRAQTILARMEVIVADNASNDGSDQQAARLLAGWPKGRFIQHGANLGYCEGNNRAAAAATGEFLFFLNNDTWLEPDCLELLLAGVETSGAAAANPLILDYADDQFQSLGAAGLDVFGLSTARHPFRQTREVFMPDGCAYWIKRDVFVALGGFDRELFMFSDELDLSWRLWAAGHTAVGVPSSRMHHRGAAAVNPAGGEQVVEFRTSDRKRFFANRNSLLVVLKNAQHLLLTLAILQVLLLGLEALIALALVRRWSFVRRAYLDAVLDCWRLRHHVLAERRRLRALRRRSDFWMLRFLRFRPNRWDEFLRMLRHGAPKVTEN